MVRRSTSGVAALLLVGLLAACGAGGTRVGGHGTDGGPGPGGGVPTTGAGTRPVPKVPSAPDYASLKVGTEPYVNACRAYAGKQSVISAFDKYIPTNAVIQATYAENPLPPSWYTTPADKATSSCTVEFADPPWDDATIIFGIDQYGSAALARAAFTQYKPQSQAEIDKTNEKYGTHLTVSPDNTSTIPGLANTYFQATSGTSYTLVGNKIVSINGGTVVAKSQYLAALRTAVPRAVAAVQVPNQQADHGSADFGKHIGTARYVNPCTVLTAAAFTKVTHRTVDPTDVELIYNASAVTHPRSVQPDGIATNTCERRSLVIGNQSTADLSVRIGYFSSTAQALQQIRIRRAKDGKDVKSVTGMGAGAYTYKFAGITSLTVAHGPYTLTVDGSTVSGSKRVDGPLAFLEAAVRATTPQLGR